MNLSISNSRPYRREFMVCALLCLGVLASLCVLGALLWKKTPLNTRKIASASIAWPDGDEYFLANARQPVEVGIFYHKLDPDLEANLKKAEILWIGNSRIMYLFSGDKGRALLSPKGSGGFALGFGFAECQILPLELIKRYDLHPRIVIVNCDRFFRDRASKWSETIMRQSAWNSRKLCFEANTSLFIEYYLHQFLPHWPEILNESSPPVFFRSRRNGSWLPFYAYDTMPSIPFVASVPEHIFSIPSKPQGYAQDFQDELSKRGSRLALIYVPRPGGNPNEARAFAELLQVPLALTTYTSLNTIDGSHLDKDSADAALVELVGSLNAQHVFDETHINLQSIDLLSPIDAQQR